MYFSPIHKEFGKLYKVFIKQKSYIILVLFYTEINVSYLSIVSSLFGKFKGKITSVAGYFLSTSVLPQYGSMMLSDTLR
jgi:hypothetical protein